MRTPSRSHENATWLPSGENVGKLSEPGSAVSGVGMNAVGSGGEGHSAASAAAAAPSAPTSTRIRCHVHGRRGTARPGCEPLLKSARRPSSAARISAALCTRRVGSLRRHSATSAVTAAGTCGATTVSDGGSRVITAASVAGVEPARNARRPESIS